MLKLEKVVSFEDSTLYTARELLDKLVRVTCRLASGFQKGFLWFRCLTLALL